MLPLVDFLILPGPLRRAILLIQGHQSCPTEDCNSRRITGPSSEVARQSTWPPRMATDSQATSFLVPKLRTEPMIKGLKTIKIKTNKLKTIKFNENSLK